MSLIAVAVLITSTSAPALLESLNAGTQSVGALSDVGLRDAPPASMAFGLYVSGLSPGAPPLLGPAPIAESHTTWGRSEQKSTGAELQVRDPVTGNLLAHVKGLKDEAVTRTIHGVDKHNNSIHWSTQARAHSYVAWASLLDGNIVANVLHAHVFTSANERNESTPLRMDVGGSRVADLKIFNTYVDVQRQDRIPIPGVGTLWVNHTIADLTTGTLTNYALHLEMDNGMDIIVSGATAQVKHLDKQTGLFCMTWSEGYPVGSTSKVLNYKVDARHNTVMSDVWQSGVAHGRLDDVPVEAFNSLLTVDAALATHDAVVVQDNAWANAVGEVVRVEIPGLISADHLRATATVRAVLDAQAQGLTLVDSTGSRILGLSVMGSPMNDLVSVGTNTNFPLVNPLNDEVFAQLFLNEQTVVEEEKDGIAIVALRVNMVRLVITADNAFGIPIGTQLVLGHAIASAACGEDHMPMPPMDWGDPLGFRPTPPA